MAVLGGGICLVATIVSRRRQEEPKGDDEGPPQLKPLAGNLDVQERPPEPGSVVAWCLRLSHRGRAGQDSAAGRRIRGMSRWCARQRNCTAGARRAPVPGPSR
jgi:hypothetical protein